MRFFFFFFSSRRRHTRLQGDWSSDVCSSDLVVAPKALPAKEPARLGKKTLRGGDREASTGDEPQGGRSRLWPRGLRPDRGLLVRPVEGPKLLDRAGAQLFHHFPEPKIRVRAGLVPGHVL